MTLLGSAALTRWRGSGSLPPRAWVCAAVLLLLGTGVAVLVSADIVELVPAALVSALAAALTSRARFQRLHDSPRMHWMDSLPLTRITRVLHLRIQAALPVGFVVLGVLAVAPFDLMSAVLLSASFALAVLLALLLPLPAAAAYPASRYRIGSPSTANEPSLAPLTADLSTAVAGRLQPRNLARVLTPFLLIAPSGLARSETIAMVFVISAGLYLHALAGGLQDCVEGARRWSAALPIAPDVLRSHWWRAARRRAAVAAAAIAIPLFPSTSAFAAIVGLSASLLWIEWAVFRVRRS